MSSVTQGYQFQLLPELASNEYEALKADIAQNGVLIPVELDENGALLDGHHRVRAWKELTEAGVKLPPYPSIVRRFHSDDEKVEHALKTNLMRRHLDREQLKSIAEDLRKRTGDYWTLEKVAETLGVDPATVSRWVPASTFADAKVEDIPRKVGKDGKSRPVAYKPRAATSTVATGPKETERALTAMEAFFEDEAEGDDEGEFVNTSTGELLTSSQLHQQATHRKRELQRREIEKGNSEMKFAGKHRVIYADPPWKYGDERTGLIGYSAAVDHYPTMSISELKDLPVKALAEDNAVLFLWATSPLLPDALALIEAWGFTYKSSFIWDKVKHNVGHYNSVRHELLLISTRGSCTPDVKKLFDSVQVIERTNKHSQKPEEFREIIDTLYPPVEGDRIELFRRGDAPEGWKVWGNESAAA